MANNNELGNSSRNDGDIERHSKLKNYIDNCTSDLLVIS